jgi:hypothetical protein
MLPELLERPLQPGVARLDERRPRPILRLFSLASRAWMWREPKEYRS